MAIMVDGKIISNKEVKKIQNKKPTKKELQKSNIGRNIFFIEEGTFDLYEGTIIEELNETFKVNVYNRNINKSDTFSDKEIEKKKIKFIK